jgi:predicted nucleic acid-binding protein
MSSKLFEHFKPVSLSEADYPAFLRESAAAQIQGGSIYDAVHLKSAAKAGVERVYTFHFREFQAIAPRELASSLCTP